MHVHPYVQEVLEAHFISQWPITVIEQFLKHTWIHCMAFSSFHLQVLQSLDRCVEDCNLHWVYTVLPERGRSCTDERHPGGGWGLALLAMGWSHDCLLYGDTVRWSTLRLGASLFPPKPPAPMMKIENWLMASSSPDSERVSAGEMTIVQHVHGCALHGKGLYKLIFTISHMTCTTEHKNIVNNNVLVYH